MELSDEAVHLLFSANRWELVEKMKTYLELGVNVILDRYAYSGVAYSSAKGLDLKWCMAPDSGLPEPDIIFEIYLPQETRGLRHGFGEERYETLSFQDRVCESYEALHCHHLETSQSPWIRIDGSVSPEEVTGSIIEKLSKILEEFDNIQPLGALRWISN